MADPEIRTVGIRDVRFGLNVKIGSPVNLYGCEIGDDVFIGPFVEIQQGVCIGRGTRVQSHAFICELVDVGEDCVVSHGVKFVNDLFQRGGPARGDRSLWRATSVGHRVSIGANATILPVRICDDVVIGAGAVVTRDIHQPGIYAGNPARLLRPLTAAAEASGIPLVDLQAQYRDLQVDLDAAIRDVIRQSAFVRGAHVERFEREFAAAVGVQHCVSCGNGTDALYIALRALGMQPGDEVITTAHSWISTSATITQAGGKIVFCDTDAETYCIDPVAIERLITPRTVGIVPVHLYGQPADMPAIMTLAQKHRLWVVEDCAQAHLARVAGQQVGTLGAAAAYSFYPGKNLGAMGDAGAVVTDDADLARRMARIARHGGLVKGEHEIEGINSRLDGLQAAILGVKLPHLRRWTERRRAVAGRYAELLGGLTDLLLPKTAAGREHVFHLFVVQHPRRDALAAHLRAAGIQSSVNYPVALPFLPAYHHLGHQPSDFPNAHRHQQRVLSLPMYPELTEEQLRRIGEVIRSF